MDGRLSMSGKEKCFENKIKRYLESLGIYRLGTPSNKMLLKPIGYYEKRHGSMFVSSGLPDMHIVVNGHSIEVEVKAENGRASELQKLMLDQINTCGGKGLLVYPKDFATLKQTIEEYL